MTKTTNTGITLERFEDLLDRHGSELARWPDDAGIAAQSLLPASPEARALHAQAAALEQRLAGFHAPDLSSELRCRLLDDFNGRRTQRAWLALLWLQLGGARIAVPALAAALMLGLAIGSWLPSTAVTDGGIGSDDALALLQYDLGNNGDWAMETPQ